MFGEKDIAQKKIQVAKEFLLTKNSKAEFILYDKKLLAGFNAKDFASCDMLIDGSDNLTCKLLVNAMAYQLQRPVLIGAAAQYAGQVGLFDATTRHACYGCLFGGDNPNNHESDNLEQMANSPELIANCQQMGIVPATLSIVAGVMARLLFQYIEKSLAPQFYYLINDLEILTIKTKKRKSCQVCG